MAATTNTTARAKMPETTTLCVTIVISDTSSRIRSSLILSINIRNVVVVVV